MDGDGLRDWIEMRRRFHAYSFHNTSLVWLRGGDASWKRQRRESLSPISSSSRRSRMEGNEPKRP